MHWVDARTAMLHLSVDADECPLAVGHRRRVKQLDQIGHQPLTEHCPCLEQRPQIVDNPSGEGVADHGHTNGAHDRSRRGDPEPPRRSSLAW